MFTVARLGIDGRLANTLTTSNPVESVISIARTTNRNATRWRDGQMVLRWTEAGMLNAARSFPRIKGLQAEVLTIVIAYAPSRERPAPTRPPRHRIRRAAANGYRPSTIAAPPQDVKHATIAAGQTADPRGGSPVPPLRRPPGRTVARPSRMHFRRVRLAGAGGR
jgi:hypothetical protein